MAHSMHMRTNCRVPFMPQATILVGSMSFMTRRAACCWGRRTVLSVTTARAPSKSKATRPQQIPIAAAVDGQVETYEEPPKGNRRNDKDFNRCSLLPMIAKETLPALKWPAQPRHHVDRDRRLRDIDAQFEQLAVDPG